jgi:ParB family chromosome partitioning protein
MSSKKRDSRLGTGLDALFGTDVASVLEDIENSSAGTRSSGTRLSIPIDQITPNPYQPRQDFDPDRLQELAASIREHGVFTPILVRRSLSGWQLIAGERRLRAARLAGLTEIPAIAVEFNDEQMMEISLLENIQRENLNPIEEAQGYQQLMDKMHYTQQQLSDKIGKSREYIANMLRLLKLPAQTQNLLAQQKLTPGQVRPLITLGSPETIDTLAARIAKEG